MITDRPTRTSLSTALAVLLTLGATACEPPPDAEAAAADDESPAQRDSMYGTPAVDNLRVTRVDIEVPFLPAGLDGFRVAAISDLAIGGWDDGARVASAAIRRAVDEEPDMLALLGGFFLQARDTVLLERILRDRGDVRTIAVLSAGDLGDPARTGPRDALIATLGRLDIDVLRNRRIMYARGDDTLWIAGLDGDAHTAADWRRAEMIRAIGAEPPVALLLTHSPLVAPRFPERRYGLVLTGGTTCRSIGLPGRPRLSDLQEGILEPFATEESERYFVVDGNPVFVTCGVGHTFLPTRLAGPAEIVVLRLRSTGYDEEEELEAEPDEEVGNGEIGDAPETPPDAGVPEP